MLISPGGGLSREWRTIYGTVEYGYGASIVPWIESRISKITLVLFCPGWSTSKTSEQTSDKRLGVH